MADVKGDRVCAAEVPRSGLGTALGWKASDQSEGPDGAPGCAEGNGANSPPRHEVHIDPHRIGVLGFSAGGHLAADISTHFDKRLYPAVDAADKGSCRPDFAVALYPGHLWIGSEKFELNPDIPVTRQTPPTFLVHSENDPVDTVGNSLVYYIALKSAGVPVEMHLFAEGKHAFGLRRTQYPITRWPELVETWLRTSGFISP